MLLPELPTPYADALMSSLPKAIEMTSPFIFHTFCDDGRATVVVVAIVGIIPAAVFVVNHYVVRFVVVTILYCQSDTN